MNNTFTHLDDEGRARMVDVTKKDETVRRALARGCISVSAAVYEALVNKSVPKGDVFSTARVAGIMGAKRTHELIPLCHPLMITGINLDFELPAKPQKDGRYVVVCSCEVSLKGRTGVEMEALTGVSVALLTVYDMCKALDKTMEIGRIHLVEKEGGKSGHFINPSSAAPGTSAVSGTSTASGLSVFPLSS